MAIVPTPLDSMGSIMQTLWICNIVLFKIKWNYFAQQVLWGSEESILHVERGHIALLQKLPPPPPPDNFSVLLLPRHFWVPGSTQEFPAQPSASMTNTGDQAGSRAAEDSGKGQTACLWVGLAREKERQRGCVYMLRDAGASAWDMCRWEYFFCMCGERGGFQQSSF